jgi:demethylmenaquinone methyltransferase/2-methoxy-6-polyprenyl-1,4-benzoquinol methylase
VDKKSYFGYQEVNSNIKQSLVNKVFDSVVNNYDVMNDIMSFGLHRIWKRYAVNQLKLSQGRILDIAGGTGDITHLIKKRMQNMCEIWHTDINYSMLQYGQDKLIDQGIITEKCVCNGEMLSFADESFDAIIVAFGLRNMTNKIVALEEMYRVLSKNGQLIILEFSKITQPIFKHLYELYAFNLIPKIGSIVANDSHSYKYLVESIELHPDQETLASMITNIGFSKVNYVNLTGGVVAIHEGYKL